VLRIPPHRRRIAASTLRRAAVTAAAKTDGVQVTRGAVMREAMPQTARTASDHAGTRGNAPVVAGFRHPARPIEINARRERNRGTSTFATTN